MHQALHAFDVAGAPPGRVHQPRRSTAQNFALAHVCDPLPEHLFEGGEQGIEGIVCELRFGFLVALIFRLGEFEPGVIDAPEGLFLVVRKPHQHKAIDRIGEEEHLEIALAERF